ncbi:MAG: hypothetical protein WCK80_00410 [bacterium]
MKSTNHKGFSHFETILLLVVVAVISVVGFTVYSRNNKSKADSDLYSVQLNARNTSTSDTIDPAKADPDTQQNLVKAGVISPESISPSSSKKLVANAASTKASPWPNGIKNNVASGKGWYVASCNDYRYTKPDRQHGVNIVTYASYSRPYNGFSIELSSTPKSKKYPQFGTERAAITTSKPDWNKSYATYTIRKPGVAYVVRTLQWAYLPMCDYVLQ